MSTFNQFLEEIQSAKAATEYAGELQRQGAVLEKLIDCGSRGEGTVLNLELKAMLTDSIVTLTSKLSLLESALRVTMLFLDHLRQCGKLAPHETFGPNQQIASTAAPANAEADALDIGQRFFNRSNAEVVGSIAGRVRLATEELLQQLSITRALFDAVSSKYVVIPHDHSQATTQNDELSAAPSA